MCNGYRELSTNINRAFAKAKQNNKTKQRTAKKKKNPPTQPKTKQNNPQASDSWAFIQTELHLHGDREHLARWLLRMNIISSFK